MIESHSLGFREEMIFPLIGRKHTLTLLCMVVKMENIVCSAFSHVLLSSPFSQSVFICF